MSNTTMTEKIVSKLPKSVIVVTSSIAVGIGAYAAYRYWKSRDSKVIDEGFEDVSKLEDNPERKILVLGLEGVGKSTLIAQLTTGLLKVNEIKPTEGFNVTNLVDDDRTLNIWELGGRESVRRYWPNFFQDTDLLVFVVDASDTHNIALAVKEIKALLGDDRLSHVPILVIAAKQDLPGAWSVESVLNALDVKSIRPSQHKVRVLGSQSTVTNGKIHPSVVEVKKTMFSMV